MEKIVQAMIDLQIGLLNNIGVMGFILSLIYNSPYINVLIIICKLIMFILFLNK